MSRYDADDVYCYPGTNVLCNLAGITNAKESAFHGEESNLAGLIQERLIKID
jgi:cell filamentation protein